MYNPNVQVYKYELVLKMVFKDEPQPYHVERYLRDLTVYDLYDENVFPVFQFEFFFRRDLFKKIQDHADDVKLVMDLRRYRIDNKTENNGEPVLYDVVINGETLKPFDIDRTPLPILENENDDSREPEQKTKETQTPMNGANFRIVLNCFLERHLDMNKGLISAVISGANLKDTVLYVLNRGGAKNVLMNEPENTQVYEQILLPSLNMTQTLEYLQEVYGLFSNGMTIYFGLKWSYLLRKDAKWLTITAKGGDYNSYSWKRVYMELVDQRMTSGDVFGSYIDKENQRFHIKLIDQSEFITNDTSIREIGGEAIKFLSRTKENRTVSRYLDMRHSIDNKGNNAVPVSNSSKIKEILMWNNYNNPYAESQYKSMMSRKQLQVKVPWQDIDVDILTPNRRYEFTFLNNEYKAMYNGTYQLNSTVYKLNKGRDEKYYRIFGISIFDKLHRDYFTYGLN